jgi:hypothetical protein
MSEYRSKPRLPTLWHALSLGAGLAIFALSRAAAQDAAPAAPGGPAAAPTAADLETSVAVQVANSRDPQAIYQELWQLPDQRATLELGFGSPEGRDFLLQKIGDPAEPHDQRVVLADALRVAGPVYQSKFKDITPTSWGIIGQADAKNSSYLTRVAQLALASAGDEELTLALLNALLWQATTSTALRDPELLADWDDAADVLAQLYAQTKSERERYVIEQLTLLIGAPAFAKLNSASGPVLSIVTSARINPPPPPGAITTGPAVPPRVIDLIVDFEYQKLPGSEKVTKAAIELQPFGPGGTTYVFARRVLPYPTDRLAGTGEEHVILPLSINHGQYRIFYVFMADDQIVSTGHSGTIVL